MNPERIEYQLGKELKALIEDLLRLKQIDLPEFCLVRDEIKRDLGEVFYNKHLKEYLEI
jgi:hypothetical protein